MELISDLLNKETANVSFGVSDTYDWVLIDILAQAMKLLFECYDKLSHDDKNSRFAFRKMKTRMLAVIDVTKNTIN